ncbi:unnamed protein product [Staurois parvus]|uniref:Uncharacterized protein n=2 Tax=Staurois parvus TaxID=386267 RepID=A0ABN9GGT0_9NEOB|nr:unnamed protein product [Staurois parvus]
MLHISAHQCTSVLHISAHQCISMPHISAHQSCLSVPVSDAYRAANQCQLSVPPISAHQ